MIEKLKEDLLRFLLIDINFCTEEDAKVIEKVKELAKLIGLLPIDTNILEDKRLLIIDINYLPSEYKGNNIDMIEELLTQKYGTRVLLIDSQKNNIQGANNNKPVYFI